MRFMKIQILALVIAFSPINLALGADYPSYKDGLLTIPAVNTADQVGKYQDITFKLTDQGLWQLLNLRTIGTTGLGQAQIEKIDVVKNDTFPTQVFLRISGWLSGCLSAGQFKIHQRLENNRFDISVATQLQVDYDPQVTTCPAIIVPFMRTISLSVYGLNAGTYSYNVNGTTGTFELTADNKYPGDY